jgi:hypothetical protein
LVGYYRFPLIIELPLLWLRKRGAAAIPTTRAAENSEAEAAVHDAPE